MNTANNANAASTKGFSPVTVIDLECVAHVTFEQAEAMAAMFRAIARLSSDKDIQTLCAHGALQAELQGNDIDCLRERALDAGLAGGAV